MSDLTTRSLDRSASAEALRRSADADDGRASKAATLGSRSAASVEVAQARLAGNKETALPHPPSSDNLVARQSSDTPKSRLAANGNKVESQYSYLNANDVNKLSSSNVTDKKIVSQYEALDPANIEKNVFVGPKSTVRQGEQLSAVNSAYGSSSHPTSGAALTSKVAPPLPLRAGDYLAGGGINLQAMKQREMKENLYLSANRFFTSGTPLIDRKVQNGRSGASRFSSVKKFFQGVKKLFTRGVQNPRREVSSERSNFRQEVIARGISQSLGKKDLAFVAKLGKEIDGIINKGRKKGEITKNQHEAIAQKSDAIEQVFKQNREQHGLAVSDEPVYGTVEGDYGRVRGDS